MKLKTAMAASAIMALAAFATGCGDVCDDAADICGDTADSGDEDAECTGELECTSQCIVDADSCVPAEDQKLGQCIIDCGA